MKRYGRIIKVKDNKIDEYRKYHRNVWPEHLKMLTACNLRNFSIFCKDNLLFSYFEYIGYDFKKDMERLDQDPVTIKWMDSMMTLQEPVDNKKEGEYWSQMEEVLNERENLLGK